MALFRANPATEMARLRKKLAKAADPDLPENLALRHRLGILLVETGDWPAAEEHYTELADAQVRVEGEQHPGTLGAWLNLATAKAALGEIEDAVHLMESTVDIYEAVSRDDPATMQAQLLLSEMYSLSGEYDEALDVLGRHLKACVDKFGEYHELTIAGARRKVNVLRTLGRFGEASSLNGGLNRKPRNDYERDSARAVDLLIRAESGDAKIVRHKARELAEQYRTPEFVEVLAAVLLRAGEPAEAAELYRAVLSAQPAARHWGPAGELARAYLESGQLDAAETLARELVSAEGLPAGHPLKLGFRATLARAARERGRDAEADRELEAVAAGLTEVFGPKHPDVVEVAGWLKKD
ncbi:Tetratricopeptide repeat-containing protein [Amycolatopsis rubida]|uniref:Tetratricopeptide repeat-containing protein n=1 Tax=Amycolatopsis rubida TaxID=112413 RepID=A0A1I5QN31_9PSEU|nr:Tetratricopeptide repeat-containing protein [Amycolatopsis rubida]